MNKIIVIGRVGRDPESRTIGQGSNVTNFSVAVSEKWTRNGQREEKTTWFNVSHFGRGGEFSAQYVRKGQKIAVDGRLEIREWTDSNGVTRKDPQIVAENVEILADPNRSGSNTHEQPQNETVAPNGDDDDLPF
jgi:single-strand DNA-binding protein